MEALILVAFLAAGLSIFVSAVIAVIMNDRRKKEIGTVLETTESHLENLNRVDERLTQDFNDFNEVFNQSRGQIETAWENSGKAVETADKAEAIAHNTVDKALKAEDSANEARKLVVELTGEITELKAGIAGLKNQIPSSVNYFNDINQKLDAIQVQAEAAKLERRDLEKTLAEHNKKAHQEVDARFASLQESDSNIIANLRRELGSEIRLAVGAADRANGLARNSLARLEKLEQQMIALPAAIGFQKLTQQLIAEGEVEAVAPAEPEKKAELTDEQVVKMTGADLAKYWGVFPYVAINRREEIKTRLAAATEETPVPVVNEPKPETVVESMAQTG